MQYLLYLVCLVVILITTTAAQTPELASHPNPIALPAPPVSYVYISQQPSVSVPNQLLGFAVAANGKLTPIKDSPFDVNAWPLAVNGKYLFAGIYNNEPDASSIDTYAIQPNGALKFVVSNPIPEAGYFAGFFFLSHDGATLFNQLGGGGEDWLEVFSIDKKTGTLALTKDDYPDRYEDTFTLSADDRHLYTADAYVDDPGVDSVDTQTWAETQMEPMPEAPPPQYFVPLLLSADPYNHVAGIFVSSCYWCDGDGPYPTVLQLGVYTADANGQLTTNSTYKNMPNLSMFLNTGVSDMKMSPSGKLLAVSGSAGLQVFRFNGSKPVTLYATLVKIPSPLPDSAPFKQLGWDNDNHLFTLFANELYVFTVTPTSITEAPGSPYSIPGTPGAQYIIVQPLPL